MLGVGYGVVVLGVGYRGVVLGVGYRGVGLGVGYGVGGVRRGSPTKQLALLPLKRRRIPLDG